MDIQDYYRVTNYFSSFLSGAEPFIKQTIRENGGRVSLKLKGNEAINDANFPVCSIFEGRHDKPYIRITSVYLKGDAVLVDGFDDETEELRTGFGLYKSQYAAVINFLGHVLKFEALARGSKELSLRQDAFKEELIAIIKSVLPDNRDKLHLDKDQTYLEIGYYIDCECFDDLSHLYVSSGSVTACVCGEPENDVELEYFHERSLIEIIDYLERHGYLSNNQK